MNAPSNREGGNARLSDLDMAFDRLDTLDRELVEGYFGPKRLGFTRQHLGIFLVARMPCAMDALGIVSADEGRRPIFDRRGEIGTSSARPHSACSESEHGTEATKKRAPAGWI